MIKKFFKRTIRLRPMIPWKSFTFVISRIQCKKKKNFFLTNSSTNLNFFLIENEIEIPNQDQFCSRFFTCISIRSTIWNSSIIAILYVKCMNSSMNSSTTDKLFFPPCIRRARWHASALVLFIVAGMSRGFKVSVKYRSVGVVSVSSTL